MTGKRSIRKDTLVYIVFLLVGTSTGWFLSSSLWNLISNEKLNLPNGGDDIAAMFSYTQGCVGITTGILYFCFMLHSRTGLSIRAEQASTVLLILANMVGFLIVGFLWDEWPPSYPFLILGSVLANLVGNLTMYILFPCLSTNYGGWLIAPVRAGTDFSGLLLAVVCKWQYIDGRTVRFPESTLFLGLTGVACIGLTAWLFIVFSGVGLREASPDSSCDAAPSDVAAVSGGSHEVLPQADESCGAEGSTTYTFGKESADSESETSVCTDELDEPALKLSFLSNISGRMSGLYCPRKLFVPVVVGTLSQVCQWSFASALGFIASSRTDPSGCDGDIGAAVNRQAQTLSNIFLPAASIMSSVSACPRWLYLPIAMVQLFCTCVVFLVACGVRKNFWITDAGQNIFIGCYSLVAGLEGYLLTMAYRYIGDDEEVPLHYRQSSSRLLSLAGVLLVNPTTILISQLTLQGFIGCS